MQVTQWIYGKLSSKFISPGVPSIKKRTGFMIEWGAIPRKVPK